MRNVRILIIISGCLLALLTTQVYGIPVFIPFEVRIKISDIIVEGVIEKQTDNPDYARGKTEKFSKKSELKVIKVYKGNVSEGDKITIYSERPGYHDDKSYRIVEGGRFLIMGKNYKSGFIDIGHGNGIWEIVTLKPNLQLMAGNELDETWGQPYEQFENDLIWTLSTPPKWPEEPAISAEQAEKITLEAFSNAKIDLKGYELTKQVLTKHSGSIIGFAYEDDTMWNLRWVKSEFEEQSMPYGRAHYFCYVHAHTGKAFLGPNFRLDAPSAENACRLFLKTHKLYRQKYSEYADDAKFIPLTQDEFDSYYPFLNMRFRISFLSSPYPKDTKFLKVEFSDDSCLEPVIFAIKAGGYFGFACMLNQQM